MATGILGLGTGQAASLNQDLIDKLKEAERVAKVEPIETNIESITANIDSFTEINQAVQDLLESVKPFDLFISDGVNAFEEKSASTSGTSVTFDATDTTSLNNGFTTVNVTQIGQKDVYQSDLISSADVTTTFASGGIGSLTIQVGTETYEFQTGDTTDVTATPPVYSSYEELTSAINDYTGIYASLDEVSTGQFRLVIKSEEVGAANALTIGGDLSTTLGYDNSSNHTLIAQDMKMTVDGVAYEASSNEIVVDGLTITANREDLSTINIGDDTSYLETQMQNFIDKYNTLQTLIDDATAADSDMYNKSGLKAIVQQIKDKLFGTYGENTDKSVFSYGLGFSNDLSGQITLDSTAFNQAIEGDLVGLRDLFIGDAANKGLGTQLKELLDEMSFSDGTVSLFEDSLTNRQTTLNEEKTKAEEALNAKYEQLAAQFVAYSSIITQFETAFGGLKMMIEQSVATN